MERSVFRSDKTLQLSHLRLCLILISFLKSSDCAMLPRGDNNRYLEEWIERNMGEEGWGILTNEFCNMQYGM